MNTDSILDNLNVLVEAPGGINSLRSLILKLAVTGKLVDQDESDKPAIELLPEFLSNRARMIADGLISRPRDQTEGKERPIAHVLPPTWEWYYISEVGAVVGGGTPSTANRTFWAQDRDVSWLTPADMKHQASRHVSSGARDITQIGLQNSSARLLPTGTVLFSSRAPIGHVGITSQPLATNQGFKSCVPYITEMSDYIYLFLRQIGPSIDSEATGTTFKEVSGKKVSQIAIPVPPLAEQRRIVAKVDELMALCDQLEDQLKIRNKIAERYSRAVVSE